MKNEDHDPKMQKPERYKRKMKQKGSWISKSLLTIPNLASSAFGDSKNEPVNPFVEKPKSSTGGSKSPLSSNVKKRWTLSSFSVFDFGKKTDDEEEPKDELRFERGNRNPLRRSRSVGNNMSIHDDDVFETDTETWSDIQPPSEPSIRSVRRYPNHSSSDRPSIGSVRGYPDHSSSDRTTGSSNESDRMTDDFDTESIMMRKHGLKHLSRSTPTMSPSGSPPHSDSEGGQSHISRRTKKFLRRFRSVPPSEKVVNYYACAIVSDILLQGTLYITENYFAFYSNIFGYVNRTLIPIADVCSIQKEKTAKFIPNAVGIQTIDGKTYVFSSLISRDSTYKFMNHLWRKSRKLTDSDIEASLPLPEEQCYDSASNSGDSAGEYNDDYHADTYDSASVVEQNRTIWAKATPVVASEMLPTETSVSNSENDSYKTPETCRSTSSYNDLKSPLDAVGSSGSDNEVSIRRRENGTHKSTQKANVKNIVDTDRKVKWSVRTKVNSAINIGVAPFRAVKEGLQDVAFMPSTPALLIVSSSLIILLLISAIFMIYRVETLSNQLNADTIQYGDLYEEVLRMQQKIHAATAKEIENTLNHQIRQLVTVKQSLEALIFLLDTNRSSHSHPPPVSEKSY